jgi:hypothetical protein
MGKKRKLQKGPASLRHIVRYFVSLDSLVGTATSYGIGGWSSIPRSVNRLLSFIQRPYLFWVECPELEAVHLSSSSA